MAVAPLSSTARLIAASLALGALATPVGSQERDLGSFGRGQLGGKAQLGGPSPHLVPPATRSGPQHTVHNPVAAETTSQEHLRAAAGDRIFFSEGSAEIGARGRDVLAAQAAWLTANKHVRVVLEGHADDPLPARETHALAARRADAVRRRLIAEGVAAERISSASYGAERRIAVCPEPECAAQNRRVLTLVLTPTAGRATTFGSAQAMPR
jgi:outer membrane protein OmpA-like peptidoglycan-associated protein